VRPVEEIYVGRPHHLHTGSVDEPTIKKITSQGYVVVPPCRTPHHLGIGSHANLGLSQRQLRLLDDRNSAARSDENTGNQRVSAAGVPAHNDVADSSDSRTGRVADWATKNMGERDHPIGDGRAKSEVPARRGPRPKTPFGSARVTFGRSETETGHNQSIVGLMPMVATCSTSRRPK
jgi:hypothetical protein